MWISSNNFMTVDLEGFELVQIVDLLYYACDSFNFTCHFVDVLYFLFQMGEQDFKDG